MKMLRGETTPRSTCTDDEGSLRVGEVSAILVVVATPRNIDLSDASVQLTLSNLKREFTMVDFMREHEHQFISDVGQSAGESENVATAVAIAAALRRNGRDKHERRASVRDDNRHPTTTSVWRKP